MKWWPRNIDQTKMRRMDCRKKDRRQGNPLGGIEDLAYGGNDGNIKKRIEERQ